MSLALQHSPADIARWLMIQDGIGTDPASALGWPIYATGEPAQPDAVITVYDTTPQHEGRAMVGGESQQHYGIQVRVRSNDPVTGLVKAKVVENYLNETINYSRIAIGTNLYIVYCYSQVMLLTLGKDVSASKRSLFTINAMMALDRLTDPLPPETCRWRCDGGGVSWTLLNSNCTAFFCNSPATPCTPGQIVDNVCSDEGG